VRRSCPCGYLGLVERTCVGAADDLTVGECDMDAVGGGLFMRAEAVHPVLAMANCGEGGVRLGRSKFLGTTRNFRH
jgi:hypothetical protein